MQYIIYENVKNNLIERNKHRDKQINCHEIQIIPGIENLNLIKAWESGSCWANCYCFMLFTLLTLAGPYKLYFNLIYFY